MQGRLARIARQQGIALALAVLCGAGEAAQVCSKSEMASSQAGASAARDWDAMYDAYHRFSPCDEGGVAQAFTDSIAYLLASRWSELHDLEHFAEANRHFRAFVLKHIDATASEQDLRRILGHAKDCPGYARPICREIENRARAALAS